MLTLKVKDRGQTKVTTYKILDISVTVIARDLILSSTPKS